MIRELVLDTETTGFSPENGDKIVEIGIVELINHIPTQKNFHCYLNPERSVPDSAFKVHGLSYDFLKDKPVFSEIFEAMLKFIGNDKIIIHNAAFDLNFLNFELSKVSGEKIKALQVIDTLLMAREKFPGSPVSLDALCRRFSIDNSKRELHGALLDSYILANVYLELIGGSQPDFHLLPEDTPSEPIFEQHGSKNFFRKPNMSERLTDNEVKEHKAFINKINGLKNWSIYN